MPSVSHVLVRLPVASALLGCRPRLPARGVQTGMARSSHPAGYNTAYIAQVQLVLYNPPNNWGYVSATEPNCAHLCAAGPAVCSAVLRCQRCALRTAMIRNARCRTV